MKPATSPRVFVGTDFILDEVLDQISDALAARGIEVVRGPRAQAGNKPVYSHAEYFPLVNRADIILVTTRFKVPPAMLDAAPRLRGVVFPSIGVDTLDIDDASRRGLIVAHGPTPENFIAMAESTVMLMVTLMLEVQSKERELRQSLPRPAMPSARMLSGKTIGIIGYGRIGLAVPSAWRAGVFGSSCTTRTSTRARCHPTYPPSTCPRCCAKAMWSASTSS